MMTDREIANIIWLKMKGVPIPENYTDEECEDIINHYWHRAMEREIL